MWADGVTLQGEMDVLAVQRRWPVDRRLLMLHSGRVHPQWSRWSVLASPAGTLRYLMGPGGAAAGQWLNAEDRVVSSWSCHRPLTDLRQRLGSQGPGLWLGYLAYDVGRWIEDLPSRAAADRHWPCIEWAWCPGWLCYDGVEQCWQAHGRWRHWPTLGEPMADGPWTASDLVCASTPQQHRQAVVRAIEYIHAGDTFQINLAQRFTARFEGQYPLAARSLYRKLATVSPAWYGAYLELAPAGAGEPQRVIASTSPELFLQLEATGRVVTRPIKGTRPASDDPRTLVDSGKDRAELHIIVDLLRNDLGRVCEYGSVRVLKAREVESHPTVHHGVATIEGRMHPPNDIVSLLRATLPGGSITGAPKVRTMQIIDELEPVRRGPYCGSIGMIHVPAEGLDHASAALNITIRTLLLECGDNSGDAGRVDFSVGGGIVADSQPLAEYEETLDKAAALLRTLGLPRPAL